MLTGQNGLTITLNKSFPERLIVLIKMAVCVVISCMNTINEAQTKVQDTLIIINSLDRNAQPVTRPKEKQENKEPANLNLLYRNKLTGDWWGARKTLSESGLDFKFVYKAEIISNVYQGSQIGTATLDNIDLMFSADLEKSIGWNNTTIFIYILGNSGDVPNSLCNTLQGISNIETISTWKLYQFLIAKSFFDERLSVQIGLYDLNSEFDTKETSSIFINPSHGIGPDLSKSGLNGPSIFPTTSLALRLKWEFESGNYFQTAILDGVPGDPENPFGTHIILDENDGVLLTTEFGFVRSRFNKLDSKIAIGAWAYTRDSGINIPEMNNNSFSTSERNYGFYLNMEKLLTDSENGSRNVYGYLRIGCANQKINLVDYYVGTGIRFNGLFSSGKDDEFGIAFALAHCSPVYRDLKAVTENIFIKSYEINLEATYIYQLAQWLKLQPDIQYIINPSYCMQSNSAIVLGTRIQVIF